jgi:hypothetical protein
MNDVKKMTIPNNKIGMDAAKKIGKTPWTFGSTEPTITHTANGPTREERSTSFASPYPA